MSPDDPEVTTVTSKGLITIPGRRRKQFDFEQGRKRTIVSTNYGLVLKTLDLPSVEQSQQHVEGTC